MLLDFTPRARSESATGYEIAVEGGRGANSDCDVKGARATIFAFSDGHGGLSVGVADQHGNEDADECEYEMSVNPSEAGDGSRVGGNGNDSNGDDANNVNVETALDDELELDGESCSSEDVSTLCDDQWGAAHGYPFHRRDWSEWAEEAHLNCTTILVPGQCVDSMPAIV